MKEIAIKYWLEALFGVVTLAIGFMYKKVAKKVTAKLAEQDIIKEGLRAILHDRIYQACEFYIKQGYVTVDGLRNIDYLYESYHDLDGNGTGTELYNRAKALPFDYELEEKGVKL